jgi:hypothetical protein
MMKKQSAASAWCDEWWLPRSKRGSDGQVTEIIKLLDTLGFDGLDAGSLQDSWRQQP